MTNDQKRVILQVFLLLVTIATTTIAGTEWMYSKYVFWVEEEYQMHWSDFLKGFNFSIPFLLILTVHEFGHYFTARYHRVKVTLPFYIPLWLGFVLMPSFGTMGAVIRIKEHIYKLKHYFDIGIAGPLAGFVVAIVVIWYGFTHLPEPDYIFQIHPEYEKYGQDYAQYAYQNTEDVTLFTFGDNLVYWFMKNYVADADRLPHPNEMLHYPLLLAGYLALFFTSLNLLPIGQLDGGHILFGLAGPRRHAVISRVLFTAFVFYAGLGLITIHDFKDIGLEGSAEFLFSILLYIYFLYVCAQSMFKSRQERLLFATVIFTAQFALNLFTGLKGYEGWLLFGLVLGRFLGVDHPPVIDYQPLSRGRKILGWIALIVFLISFSPQPFQLS